MQPKYFIWFCAYVLSFSCNRKISTQNSNEKTVRFSGYEWRVKDHHTLKGPGPNYWSDENVWVDSDGKLHLKLTYKDGKWYCAEVETTQKFLYGTFEFRIEGRIDSLDKNVVFACFTYPGYALDHHHEMDIEFTKWGEQNANNLHYTVWPANNSARCSFETNFRLKNDRSTHRFTWAPNSVLFQSLHGFSQKDVGEFYRKICTQNISNIAMPVLINLWLYAGNKPSHEASTEIVIAKFTYTPL